MKRNRMLIKIFVVIGSLCLFCGISFGQTSINIPANSGSTSVPIDINVGDPTGIAGAAFTLEYDISSLSVIDVQSAFFETFSAQQTLSGNTWPATSVTVSGTNYDQPIMWGESTLNGPPQGLRVAGARYTGAPTTHTTTLFTVTFQLKSGAAPGTYSINVVPTQLCNPDAGYGLEPDGVSPPNFDGDEDYDPILELLIAADTNYTSKLTATGETDVLATGSATFLDVPYNFDVDGNGVSDALTDGIMIVRYLFNITGANMADGALGSGATRTIPEIEAYIEQGKTSNELDVDGNGVSDALTDGIMIVRYLFNITGANMADGALGSGATRTIPEIEAYIEARK